MSDAAAVWISGADYTDLHIRRLAGAYGMKLTSRNSRSFGLHHVLQALQCTGRRGECQNGAVPCAVLNSQE